MKKFAARAALLTMTAGFFVPLAYALGINTTTSRLTLAANAGGRNCLKYLDVTVGPGSNGTLRILANGTTVYAVDLSSGGGMIRDWDDVTPANQMPCTPKFNQIMEVYVDSTTFRLNTLSVLK